MPYETVIWEQVGAVGRVILNRPETLNAWTAQFGSELREVLEGEAAHESVRAVLVTGAGRGFSSGADLKAGFEPADDGMPDIRRVLHEHHHRAIAGGTGVGHCPAVEGQERCRGYNSDPGTRDTGAVEENRGTEAVQESREADALK